MLKTNIAMRIYENLIPEEAAETMLYEMKGWQVYRLQNFNYTLFWKPEIVSLKFKKGGKVCFKNGFMKQDYNW